MEKILQGEVNEPMKCEMEGCSKKFDDDLNGLCVWTWHKILCHPIAVNRKESESFDRRTDE